MERRVLENGNVQLSLDKNGGSVLARLTVEHGCARSAVSLSGYRDVLSALAVLESTLKHLIEEERREIAEAIDSSRVDFEGAP
ncbi:hypothetical protein [Cerasicoccus maritimus]|uniref:hypothetical protein n=1 Tax=Cerasicoccus maritimus TaxID=490089 RepID=UPI002852CB98|nr:hypothetical protein [Cerasicoccus maritimus]